MTTRYLQLSQPRATGVVLTDTALRFVMLSQHNGSSIPGQYAELAVPEGALKNGAVANRTRFVNFLRTLRKTYKIESVNLVLNSQQVQAYSLSLKAIAAAEVKESVEKLFGIPAKDIVYEFKPVGGNGKTVVLQVTAIAKNVSEGFVNAFKQAGISVLSIEPVGHALARAIVAPGSQESALVISVDTRMTSLSYVVNGRVSETTLVDFGDVDLTKKIMDHASVDVDQADKAKREQGMVGRESRIVFDAISDDCAELVKHINDSYIKWKNAHQSLPAIEGVYLTGAGSVIKGLDEYIASGLRIPVKIGNVWANCLSFDEHIPEMPYDVAARYGAAIGTTLMGAHMVNLVPDAHQRSLRRKHVARRSWKVFVSFVFGVVVGALVTRIIAIPGVHSKIFEVLHKIPTQW